MNLYVTFCTDDCALYVFAKTRNIAKARAASYLETEYINVRAYLVAKNTGGREEVCGDNVERLAYYNVGYSEVTE